MNTYVYIENNFVLNIFVSEHNFENIVLPDINKKYEKYDELIHPWGPNGFVDIEVGVDWKKRLKIKLGYCIFCGDNDVSL